MAVEVCGGSDLGGGKAMPQVKILRNLKRILRDRFGTNFEDLILVILKAQFLYVGCVNYARFLVV